MAQPCVLQGRSSLSPSPSPPSQDAASFQLTSEELCFSQCAFPEEMQPEDYKDPDRIQPFVLLLQLQFIKGGSWKYSAPLSRLTEHCGAEQLQPHFRRGSWAAEPLNLLQMELCLNSNKHLQLNNTNHSATLLAAWH